MLLTNEEFGNVTLESIKTLSDRQKKVFYSRFKKGGLEVVECPPILTKDTFLKLTLSQMQQIPIDQLDQFIDVFEPEMMQVLTETQLCGLDIPNLSQAQFDYVYSNISRISKIEAPKLQQFINRINENFYRLSYLLDSQIQVIDFKAVLIDKSQFNGLAGWEFDQNKGRAIRALTPQQVIDCLNRGLFDETTAKYISPEQVEKTDFTQVSDLSKAGESAVFNSMVRWDSIKKLSTLSLAHLLPHIDAWRLSYLDDTQIQAIDFKNVPINNPQFNGLAQVDGTESSWEYDEKKGRAIRALTPQQVIDCLNRGLFDKTTAKYISPEQVEKIDFTQVSDLSKAGGSAVFNSIARSDNIKKLSTLSLAHLLPHIDGWRLSYLDDIQIQAIDFKNVPINKPQFNGLAQLDGTENSWEHDEKKGRAIRALMPKQVIDCLNRGLFDSNTLRYLSNDQIQKLDYSTLMELKPRIPLIDSILKKKSKP